MPFVVAMGEILWDCFPDYRRLGGATANFIWHSRSFGLDTRLISRVGNDTDGQELRDRLQSMKLPDELVSTDAEHPTGTVKVVLDPHGQPSYEIVAGVAWDHLVCGDAELAAAHRADLVCFGALAQRHPDSRRAIRQLVAATPERAIRIFDINLRQNYYSAEIVETSLALATVLKLNDEELPVLAALFHLDGATEEARLRQLLVKFELAWIVYTRGAHGSLLLNHEAAWDHPGYPCRVTDSVGAGDSFTATVGAGLLKGWNPEVINDRANRVAAFVCSQPGATPVLPPELLG